MSDRWVIVVALVLCSASCGPGAHTRAGGGVGALSVHEVAWNPTQATVGQVRAVAEAAGVTAVFADVGATILSAGAVIAVDRSEKDWVDAAAIPGADGSARWIVGLSRNGRLYRLKDRSTFEEVSARYGLDAEPVRTFTPFGNGLVAFLLPRQVAIADGNRVDFYNAPGFTNLLAGGGYGVGLVGTDVYMFGLTGDQVVHYSLPGLKHAALGADGRLYASTARAIYVAAPERDLSLAYDSESRNIQELVATRDTVWFSEAGKLGVLANDHVLETDDRPIVADTKLSPTATSDVWAISGGTLRRFSRVVSTPDRTARWGSSIAPVFARVCAACHEPNGVSGIDLSTAEAWDAERAAIRERVVETRTMPPQGHDLSASDRAEIDAWSRSSL
jgi:hypothetical protein